jgi:hypothetical protein
MGKTRKPNLNLGKLALSGKDGRDEAKVKALARRAIQLLERRGYAPTLSRVWEAAQELRPKGGPEATVQVISRERYERDKGFFEALWAFLEVFPPPLEVEEALREGRGVLLWLSQGQKGTQVDFVVEDKPQKHFSLHRRIPIPLSVDSRITELRVVVDNVYAQARDGRSNAFLRTDRGERRALKAVRYFRPLLEVLDLSDLERALETLTNLPPWEKGRVEGGYFMAKSPYFSVLKRGLVLGDPALDGAFFRGEPVVLSYPEGVKLFLEATFALESEEWYAGFGKVEVKIEWRGEAVTLRRDVSMRRWDFLCDDPITSILRHELRMASYYQLDCSPAMSLFLRELSGQDNILKALADRQFHRKVWRKVALEALASF